MTSHDWGSLKELFHAALELPPDARARWLDHATGGDPARIAQVLELLRAADTADGFLDAPAAVAPEDVSEEVESGFDLRPGARVGSYEVIREIGRGGMGVVYLARDLRLGRDVALKALPPEVSTHPEHRERLRREARAAATITHPSVATVYALEEANGHLFIASEYVEGRSLREVLSESRLTPEHAVAIAIEVAAALGAAHAAGVVHRDLKPDNVLVTANGTVKVVDFGIAYVDGIEGTRLTQHGALLGTPAYMAPEQLVGGAVDARADVYAIGLLLGEMVAGRHPLADGGPPAMSPTLAGIVTRCLQPEPSARFTSAAALASALRSLGEGDREAVQEARWWWGFHQGAASATYALFLIPAWFARRLIDGPLGTVLFVLALVAAVAAITMRLHLWFVSRAGSATISDERRYTAPRLRIADVVFAAGLLSNGLSIEGANSPLATLLIAGAAAAAVAFLVIEPSTTRAAFPEERESVRTGRGG